MIVSNSRFRASRAKAYLFFIIFALAAISPSRAGAADHCATLPSIDPTQGFVANFDNSCYALPLAIGNASTAGDLNASYSQVYYRVTPGYELIILGTFPNARFMSATVYDDHLVVVSDRADSAILPLTGSMMNPLLPGATYKPYQMYGLTISFGGGSPASVSPGCSTPPNIDANVLDASQIHQGITWTGDPHLPAGFPAHETGANAAGVVYIRKYMDIDSPPIPEYVLVRSLANGCAIPVQQAVQSNIVSVSQNVNSSWLHQDQISAHLQFSSTIQPLLNFPSDPLNGVFWRRPAEYIPINNSDAAYLTAAFSTTQIQTLLAGRAYLRIRFQLPTAPTTPCANGSCSFTGTEQVRYFGLTFQAPTAGCTGHTTIFSVSDRDLVKDADGNVTIVAGFGAPQPSNVTAANYYTWIDLSTLSNYTSISGLIIRHLAPNPLFRCSTSNVPFKTSENNPEGGYMGPYVPIVDFPTASQIPPIPTAASRPNSCSAVPAETPQAYWSPGGSQSCSTTNSLSAYSAIVGNTGGSGSVQLLSSGPWTATSNASWLQLSPGSTSGTGNAPIQYNYLANSNAAAQTGTLTIAGLTFTVTQAGTSYVPVTVVTPLAFSGWNNPKGVAVDGSGYLYIADTGGSAVEEWSPYTREATTLVSSGLNNPAAVAADPFGNVYIADSGNHAMKEFSPAKYQFTTLVSGLSNPSGVGVDGQGNVYFSDTSNNAIKEWNAATQQVSTLVGSGLSNPTGVAVDAQGNVYFSDTGNNAIDEWIAATQQVSTLVGSGLSRPSGLAVDGQGNVYFADTGNNAIKEWNAGNQQVAVLELTGLNDPTGVAVDAKGNIYVADKNNSVIDKLSPYYLALGASRITEAAQAGSDSISLSVLPANTVVTAASDQSWLTITGTSNGGTISFSFLANNSLSSRSAQITVLGQTVTVTQSADVPATLTKTAGWSQSTLAGQTFATPLRVRVTDSYNNPVSGVPVTFTVNPAASGASGMFSSSPPMPILTNANGSATAPPLTANGIPGTFSVTVTAGSLTRVFGATITGN